jgi:DNA-binding LytR/AlgR family response regulator
MPNTLDCLIIDDEKPAHYVLQHYIEKVDRLKLAGNCYHALEAINFLHRQPVDLLFLDINMPEIGGFQMLQTLTNPPRVILTTAHSEFALESYNYNAVDYLLKPIEFARFLKGVDKVLLTYPDKELNIESAPAPGSTSFIIKVDGDWIRIGFEDLLYSRSWGNYVRIFTPDREYLTPLTMTDLEQRLPADRFMRIHKSYLVSLAKIGKVSGNEVHVGATALPVGLTYRRALLARLQQ